MSRTNGRAVWSNCPRTDLVRAPAGQLAGATKPIFILRPVQRTRSGVTLRRFSLNVDIIRLREKWRILLATRMLVSASRRKMAQLSPKDATVSL
jgi:hypothetical protein